jgi:hypothetical protein
VELYYFFLLYVSVLWTGTTLFLNGGSMDIMYQLTNTACQRSAREVNTECCNEMVYSVRLMAIQFIR